jgi:hypothetical protein
MSSLGIVNYVFYGKNYFGEDNWGILDIDIRNPLFFLSKWSSLPRALGQKVKIGGV